MRAAGVKPHFMQPAFFSSGDLIADRRYEHAMDLAARGDLAAAIDLLQQTVERAPQFASAWFRLGELRIQAGDQRAAGEAFRACLASDPQDRLGAGLQLALLGEAEVETAMSPGYVRALFDGYAADFDHALHGRLEYRGPQMLAAAVRAAVPIDPPTFARALDLGCGTGLAGSVFRPMVTFLAGVDLSPRMIEAARRKNLYDALHVGDMLDFLREQRDGSADLVLAADAFVYLADLRPVCAAAARVLTAAGLLVFSVETHAGEGMILGEKLRYAHARQHVEEALREAGLTIVSLAQCSTRKEAGVPVPGLLAVAQKVGMESSPVDA
jgi:predicted TPR repeat methyltransferase